jgi:tetratricopeptide (TPR) repeat protein
MAPRWAGVSFAIGLCLLGTGCLSSSRLDSPGMSATPVPVRTADASANWRGELPQPERSAEILPATVLHKPDDTPRQPKTETLLLLAQRCYEAAGDATRDPNQRYDHYQQALQIYRQVLRQEPDNHVAQLGQARVYKKLGQTDQAIASLKKLLEKSPKLAAGWYELAMCYGSQQRWDEQIRCLQRACQLEPDNSRFATHLGLALARAQRWPEAEQQLQAALGPARAYYYLALMAEHVGRADLVASYARSAVQADPAFASQEQFRRWLSQAPQANAGHDR